MIFDSLPIPPHLLPICYLKSSDATSKVAVPLLAHSNNAECWTLTNLIRGIMNTIQEHKPARRLVTVRQFSERNPAFSQGSIRNLIFLSKRRKTSQGGIPGNGLQVALVRVGRKILIDEGKFFEWLDEQNDQAIAGSEVA